MVPSPPRIAPLFKLTRENQNKGWLNHHAEANNIKPTNTTCHETALWADRPSLVYLPAKAGQKKISANRNFLALLTSADVLPFTSMEFTLGFWGGVFSLKFPPEGIQEIKPLVSAAGNGSCTLPFGVPCLSPPNFSAGSPSPVPSPPLGAKVSGDFQSQSLCKSLFLCMLPTLSLFANVPVNKTLF